jgi:hypothetical protein
VGCEHNHKYAKRVMQKMAGIDIEASLAYLREQGGHCRVARLVSLSSRPYSEDLSQLVAFLGSQSLFPHFRYELFHKYKLWYRNYNSRWLLMR